MKPWSNNFRYLLSLLAIAVFLISTIGSNLYDFLSGSTNATIAIKNCEQEPTVLGTLEINVLSLDSFGFPMPNIRGHLFIVHQKVRSDTCLFDVVFNVKHEFTTDANGLASYTGPAWSHDNSQDLFRVEINWGFASKIEPFRQVQVQYYSSSEFYFTGIQSRLPPL